jgi:hypothetical protein
MERLEAAGDAAATVAWLRGGMMRNLGGVANPVLDRRALTGTKTLCLFVCLFVCVCAHTQKRA